MTYTTAVNPVGWTRVDIATLPSMTWVKEATSLELYLFLFCSKLKQEKCGKKLKIIEKWMDVLAQWMKTRYYWSIGLRSCCATKKSP